MSSFQLFSLARVGNEYPEISIVIDEAFEAPASHGLTKLTDALQAKNVTFEKTKSLDEARGDKIIVAGLGFEAGTASNLLKESGHNPPRIQEALTIFKTNWQDKPVWVICGFDDRGLMYALLDVANRIGWSGSGESVLSKVKEKTEKPDVRDRAISVYTFNRSYWESRFYDEAYWERYLDLMADSRLNSLVVIFGYEIDGFVAPAYPYFFDVEGFPEIGMPGVSPEEQQRNLDALIRLNKMANDRGISFTLGFWDHIRGSTRRARSIQEGANESFEEDIQVAPHQVQGVDAENLTYYTLAALNKFIKLMPDLDGIQFRMHDESGLSDDEQEVFWPNILKMVKEAAPDLLLTLRAKGLSDSVIQSAVDNEINFRIGTKYWMEQMGMPFHPTQVNREDQPHRRHGYADLLVYPQEYKMHWRLWSGGTTRVLLWGDPEYVRRFSESTHLYNGDGFEISEPLATKMQAHPHDAEPFDLLNPQYRYYDYEFERYWPYFLFFGRIGYNPETAPEVWQNEFKIRFGAEAAPLVEEALNKASWILPRIVASCSNYFSGFPMTRGWVEMQRIGDLPRYAMNQGSDIRQFASFDDEAQLLIEGGETARMRPSRNSLWFERRSAEISGLIDEAEDVVGDSRNKEFDSIITDLKILSNLSLFHSRRIPAAVSYRLFKRTNDVSALEDAIAYERNAIEAWREIVAAAGDVYTDDLMMGNRGRETDVRLSISGLSGHWKDELVRLEEGLASLEQERRDVGGRPEGSWIPAPSYEAVEEYDYQFQVSHQPVENLSVNESVPVHVRVSAPAGVKWARLFYRNVDQTENYQYLQMYPTTEENTYHATVPAEHLDPEYDFMYLFEFMDNTGQGRLYPDLDKETPYIIVPKKR